MTTDAEVVARAGRQFRAIVLLVTGLATLAAQVERRGIGMLSCRDMTGETLRVLRPHEGSRMTGRAGLGDRPVDVRDGAAVPGCEGPEGPRRLADLRREPGDDGNDEEEDEDRERQRPGNQAPGRQMAGDQAGVPGELRGALSIEGVDEFDDDPEIEPG